MYKVTVGTFDPYHYIYVNISGYCNLRNDKTIQKFTKSINPVYKDLFSKQIRRFCKCRGSWSFDLPFDAFVDLWTGGFCNRWTDPGGQYLTISTLCFGLNHIDKFIQVFADETIKAEIMRKAFEYV